MEVGVAAVAGFDDMAARDALGGRGVAGAHTHEWLPLATGEGHPISVNVTVPLSGLGLTVAVNVTVYPDDRRAGRGAQRGCRIQPGLP